MKSMQLVLFIALLSVTSFAATSYCSGTACDSTNGAYADPYVSDFVPGGTYNVIGSSTAHLHWTNFPSALHWYQCSYGTAIGAMQHACTGRNFGNQSTGTGDASDNYFQIPEGSTICNYVTDAM